MIQAASPLRAIHAMPKLAGPAPASAVARMPAPRWCRGRGASSPPGRSPHPRARPRRRPSRQTSTRCAEPVTSVRSLEANTTAIPSAASARASARRSRSWRRRRCHASARRAATRAVACAATWRARPSAGCRPRAAMYPDPGSRSGSTGARAPARTPLARSRVRASHAARSRAGRPASCSPAPERQHEPLGLALLGHEHEARAHRVAHGRSATARSPTVTSPAARAWTPRPACAAAGFCPIRACRRPRRSRPRGPQGRGRRHRGRPPPPPREPAARLHRHARRVGEDGVDVAADHLAHQAPDVVLAARPARDQSGRRGAR